MWCLCVKVHVHVCSRISSAYVQVSHWAPTQPLNVCVHTAVSSPVFSTTSLSPRLLSPLLLTSLSLHLTTSSVRAQCVDWTEGVLSQFAHTNISTNMTTSHWAAAVRLAYIGDLTASYWCEKCVCSRINVTGKVTACSPFLCLWSFIFWWLEMLKQHLFRRYKRMSDVSVSLVILQISFEM